MNASQQQHRPDPFAEFSGTLEQVDAINARLAALSTSCHLLTPSTTCAPPPGCAVAFTMIRIDPATGSHNVGGGKRSLLRSAILQLANAAGISWDARASGRVDDRRDPRVVHWHAAGAWRDLSGVVLPVVGDTQIDLRDGSDQALEIMANARGDKPFVVCRLIYVGHDEDPEVARENARAIRQQMLGGTRALFGPPVEERGPRMLPPASTVRALPSAVDAIADGDGVIDMVDDAPTPAPPAGEPAPAAVAPPPSGWRCRMCGWDNARAEVALR